MRTQLVDSIKPVYGTVSLTATLVTSGFFLTLSAMSYMMGRHQDATSGDTAIEATRVKHVYVFVVCFPVSCLCFVALHCDIGVVRLVLSALAKSHSTRVSHYVVRNSMNLILSALLKFTQIFSDIVFATSGFGLKSGLHGKLTVVLQVAE